MTLKVRLNYIHMTVPHDCTHVTYTVEEEDNSDDEYGRPKKGKRKGKGKASSISLAEQARADMHTLTEHNEFFLSSSFDASFGADALGGLMPSSSQVRGGLNDNFLEGLDIAGDIGEELAKELGEGWGIFSQQPASEYVSRAYNGKPLN